MTLGRKEKLLAEVVCPSCGACAGELRAVYTQQMTVNTTIKFAPQGMVEPSAAVMRPKYDDQDKQLWIDRSDGGTTPATLDHMLCACCLSHFQSPALRYYGEVKAPHRVIGARYQQWADVIRNFNGDFENHTKKFRTWLEHAAASRLNHDDSEYINVVIPNKFFAELGRIEKERNYDKQREQLEQLRRSIVNYLTEQRDKKEAHDRNANRKTIQRVL